MKRSHPAGRQCRRPVFPKLAQACAFALAALLAPTTHAQAPKLRVADSFPVGHFAAEYATKWWMEEVKRLSGGQVDFEYFPAEQLGKAKDMLSVVQTGVADIGYVSPAYISASLPLSSVVELPFDYSSSCVGTQAFWKIAKDGGALARREYGPLNVRVLFALMLPPNQLVLSKGKFETLREIEGMKIRTSGGAKDSLVRRLKAVPIQMPAPEIYESMSRGTIDGLLVPIASMFPYELDRLTKAMTTDENFGAFIITYVISDASWKKLSPAAQKAMTEAGEATTARACKLVEADEQKHLDKLKARGAAFVTLSAADKKTLAGISATVADEWAEQMNKRGKPGGEILKAFREALK